MTQVTRFQAVDGTLFADINQCQKWEDLIQFCDEAVKMLGTIRPDSNGENYVQHDPETVRAVKHRLVALCAIWIDKGTFSQDPDKIHVLGIGGRIIDDSNVQPIQKAWNRLCCIDSQCREWGQIYYAMNPEQGKLVRIA